MTVRRGLLRRLAAGLLVLGAFAAAGLHHHEDLAGTVSGAPLERVVSGHSPLSRAAHWHAGVFVKDDPCLACENHRAAGVVAELCREVPVSLAVFHSSASSFPIVSNDVASHGSRGPPALL